MSLGKNPTNIPGLDHILDGGLPAGRTTRVVLDSPGTVFAEFPTTTLVRCELRRVANSLRALDSLSALERVSTLTDTTILLRYVEILGNVRRGIAVLEMRGSTHDKDIRELTIDGSGMTIGSPLHQGLRDPRRHALPGSGQRARPVAGDHRRRSVTGR